MSALVIDLASLVPAVQVHAAECAPAECCGLAAIIKGKLRYLPCENLYKASGDVFRISEEAWAEAEDQGQIVAIVHSHVGLPPTPSEADLVGVEAHGLPWLIVNHPLGTWSVAQPSGYQAPLVGRQWVHGVLDCYSLCRDWYARERGLELPDYDRAEEWWKKGDNLYLQHFADAGFVQIAEQDLQAGDAILMMAGATVPNHAAIYLGDNTILQHVMGRLSSRDPWGGYWRKCATHFLRHRSLA